MTEIDENDIPSDAAIRESLVRKAEFLRESLHRVQMAIDAFDSSRPKRAMIDEASRKRISESQKARWARHRAEKAKADKAAAALVRKQPHPKD